MSQKSGRSAKKSTISCASSRKNNNLIEAAARNNKYTARAKSGAKQPVNGYYSARRSLDPPTCAQGKDSNELMVAANVMRLSGYQADPLAATMNTRSMGLTHVNVSAAQIDHDKTLFNQSK